MQLTRNFRGEEFACKCGCGACIPDVGLVHKLQQLRDRIKKPIVINSSTRCAKHNKAVGGERESFHLTGKAADICVPGMPVQTLLKHVEESNLFKGVGYYPKKNFVHVDTRRAAGRWTG
jgi:uncharacterized protein YcbK (DUF882 family)